MLYFILLLPFVIAAVAAYFITVAVRNKLIAKANKHVSLISTATCIISFLLILAAVAFILLYNLRIER